MKLKKSKEVIHTGTKAGDNLNYELNYVKDPLYAHRFISIGDRYYKYDEVGNIIGEQTGPYSDIQEDSELIKSIGDNVYGVETAWGFYGDEEETGIQRAKKYHREYQWDEKNQLIRSKDNNAEVMFVYGHDGKRSNKYTIDAETLYFNSYWSYYIDPSASSSGGKVSKHIFLGETRIATSINSYSNVGTGYHGEEKDHIYFYHSDHLGSASLITDYKGDEYQRIEYTPYGESWIDIKIMGAASVMPMSYKFSAKELDEETGLYYYGARYLNPKISMWISTDPALCEYIPDSGNVGSLPGMGGVFNHINFHLYHYAGNNPINYTDPDGRFLNFVIGAAIGFVTSTASEVGARMIQGQSFSDAVNNTFSDSTSLAVICASTAIGSVTSGVSGLAVNAATKSVTTAASLGTKTGVQAIAEIAITTTVINTISGAVDAGAKDVAVKALKGEEQSVTDTAKVIGNGALSAALFSGATQGIIASGTTATGQIGNVLTGSMKKFNMNQPQWAGSVGNFGENILPTSIDLGKEFFAIKKIQEEN